MDKIQNLALIAQMLDSAEKSIQSAKHLLRETLGGATPVSRPVLSTDAGSAMSGMAAAGVGKVIEGIFDGQNMIGPDGRQYPVPANYASKSKLVEGDGLKLTIAEDGSFIYKQISPIERKKLLGSLVQDERGDYRVIAEGKSYKVLLASLTYFKAETGDDVALEVPADSDSAWAAVVSVFKKQGGGTTVASHSIMDDSLTSESTDNFMPTMGGLEPADEEL